MARAFCVLTAIGTDRVGIVDDLSGAVSGAGCNIEDMETDTAAAPWTGAPMFRLRAHLVIGPSVSIAGLKGELSLLQEKHDLDIALKPVFTAGEPA